MFGGCKIFYFHSNIKYLPQNISFQNIFRLKTSQLNQNHIQINLPIFPSTSQHFSKSQRDINLLNPKVNDFPISTNKIFFLLFSFFHFIEFSFDQKLEIILITIIDKPHFTFFVCFFLLLFKYPQNKFFPLLLNNFFLFLVFCVIIEL